MTGEPMGRPDQENYPKELYVVTDGDVEESELWLASSKEELAQLDVLNETEGWFAVYTFKGFKKVKMSVDIVDGDDNTAGD